MITFLWFLVGSIAMAAGSVIKLHIYAISGINSYMGLMPWHVVCLAIALTGFATSAVLFLSGVYIFAVTLFYFCTFVSFIAFGIVIDNLRKRIKRAKI